MKRLLHRSLRCTGVATLLARPLILVLSFLRVADVVVTAYAAVLAEGERVQWRATYLTVDVLAVALALSTARVSLVLSKREGYVGRLAFAVETDGMRRVPATVRAGAGSRDQVEEWHRGNCSQRDATHLLEPNAMLWLACSVD